MKKGIIVGSENTKSIINLLKKEGVPMVVRRFTRDDDMIVVETSFLKWCRLKYGMYCIAEINTF